MLLLSSKQISALKCVDALMRATDFMYARVSACALLLNLLVASFTLTGRASVFVFLFQSLSTWRFFDAPAAASAREHFHSLSILSVGCRSRH
jgi:hypothetical protein